MSNTIDVGSVIRRTFDTYVDQASVLLPAAAVVFVIEGILSAALIAASPALVFVSFILSLVASTLFTGMVVQLVADIQDGRRDASAGQLLRAAMPVLGQLILVGLVAGIGIVVGLVLLIVPGLILITIWSVAAPVVVLERPGVTGALGRSRELVRGNGWQVFGVLVVMVILVGVVSAILDSIGRAAGAGAGLLVSVVVGVLTAPLPALAQSVLYFELRNGPAGAEPALGQPADVV
ncbi:MAG TPA: hypothetical protein VID29_05995 [Solirubrobacteraceae bacterium]|jgi:hypothetical protein